MGTEFVRGLISSHPIGTMDQPRHWEHVDGWGDVCLLKSQQNLRFVFQNINGLPAVVGPKDSSIMSFIQEKEIDFLGVAEVNINWSRVQQKQLLSYRTKGWFDLIKVSQAHNARIPWKSSFQRGGVASYIIGSSVSHVIEVHIDQKGLGRWSLTRLRGRNNKFLSIVTAYRPVPSHDPGSSYIQQQTVLIAMGCIADPRTQFFVDLREAIYPFIQEGDYVVVMIDANGDVKSGEVADFWTR